MSIYNNQIQDYIEGLLEEKELLAFEQAMLADDTLKANVERQRWIQATLEKNTELEEEVSQLKHLLEANRSEFLTPVDTPKAKRNTLKFWLGGISAAAAILLLVMTTGRFKTTDFGALPQMSDYAVRGSEIDQTYTNAVTYFNNGNYEEAITALTELKKDGKYEATAQYYLGLSYLAKKDYVTAISNLKATADGASIHKEVATYYVGYAYYQSNDVEQAKVYLMAVNSSSEYYDKAQELIRKIQL